MHPLYGNVFYKTNNTSYMLAVSSLLVVEMVLLLKNDLAMQPAITSHHCFFTQSHLVDRLDNA